MYARTYRQILFMRGRISVLIFANICHFIFIQPICGGIFKDVISGLLSPEFPDMKFKKSNQFLNTNISPTEKRIIIRDDSNDIFRVALVKEVGKFAQFCIWLLVLRRAVKSLADGVEKLVLGYGNTSGFQASSNISAYLPVNCTLNSHEIELVGAVSIPDSIDTDMELVGGLDSVKSALLTCIYDPITLPNLPSSALLRPIKGILLYGPPGCGKSTIARALGKTVRLPIISVTPSMLLRKWVGETSQLVKAMFSLSRKLQVIIAYPKIRVNNKFYRIIIFCFTLLFHIYLESFTHLLLPYHFFP